MDVFRDGQAVVVTEKNHPLQGKTGNVGRIRTDGGAWVDFPDGIPEKLRRFTGEDPRKNHVILYPDMCEPAAEVGKKAKAGLRK